MRDINPPILTPAVEGRIYDDRARARINALALVVLAMCSGALITFLSLDSEIAESQRALRAIQLREVQRYRHVPISDGSAGDLTAFNPDTGINVGPSTPTIELAPTDDFTIAGELILDGHNVGADLEGIRARLQLQDEAIRALHTATAILGKECSPRRAYVPIDMPAGLDLDPLPIGIKEPKSWRKETAKGHAP